MGASLISRSATLRLRPRDPQYDRAGAAAQAKDFAVADASQKVVDHSKAVDPHKDREWASAQFVPLSYFDATGMLATSRIPALAISDVFPASSESEQRALNAQRGDMCVRTDQGQTYVLRNDDPTLMNNWVMLASTGQVLSVNGQQGVVVLTAADIGAAALVHGNRHRPGGEDDISTQYIGWHMRGVTGGVESFGAVSSAMSAHVGATDPHNSQARVEAHRTANDPHGDRADAAAKVETHRTANDPHGDRADATTKANAAQAAATSAAATDAANKVETHRTANDPHGDRAYALSLVPPTNRLLRAGGTAGQVLAKASATDYDVSWVTPAAGSGSSTTTSLVPYPPVDQPFSTSVTPNAQTGNYRTMTATADWSLNAPSNPTDGQRLHLRWVASGAQRTMTFNVTTGIRLPIVNGITMSNTLICPSGRRADVVLLYDAADAGWTVLSAQTQAAA